MFTHSTNSFLLIIAVSDLVVDRYSRKLLPHLTAVHQLFKVRLGEESADLTLGRGLIVPEISLEAVGCEHHRTSAELPLQTVRIEYSLLSADIRILAAALGFDDSKGQTVPAEENIRAVFKAKGQSGKHLSNPIYGYKHSETDKNLWVIDDEAAEVVRKIFHFCIDGYGPAQIARILTEEGIPTPTAYALLQGRDNGHKNANLNRWGMETISGILEKPEYAGHTVNFRTHVKSYKNKKRVDNPKEDWLIFENTHEPIITQQEFDLVQELRKNKRRPTKHEEVNPFSGICYCADCGKKLYLCRATTMTVDQEHLKCGTYAKDKNSGPSLHFSGGKSSNYP